MIVEASTLKEGELPRNVIIHGNVLNVLRKFPDNSVDCIITSPPYYGMRIYSGAEAVWGGNLECEHEWTDDVPLRNSNLPEKPVSKTCPKCGAWFGQLGLETSAEMYLDHLLRITAELRRVLKPTGLMFWVHNDTYSGSWCGRKRKCMLMLPYRLAIRMINEQDWVLRNIIIWHKPNRVPSSVKDRFTNSYEPVFMFAKSDKPSFYVSTETSEASDRKPKNGRWKGVHYWFDLDAVREPFSESTLKMKNRRFNSSKSAHYAGFSAENQKRFMERIIRGEVNGRNPGDVWSIATQSFRGEHFAVFPERLVERMIKAACPLQVCGKCGKPRVRTEKGWSDCGCGAGWLKGIVLDPFAGSGTTGAVAKKLGRDFLLIEISGKYCWIAERRISNDI